MRRIAIIPARGGSQRLPRKNILPLNGQPMITYPIQAAVKSNLFDEIYVSTEDNEIASIAENYGAKVLSRPQELATSHATVADVCAYVIENLKQKPEFFCCIYATAAFITAGDLKNSEIFLHKKPEPDVVMGVSPYPIHPYQAMCEKNDYLAPLWREENHKQSRHWPEVFASNGTIYWARTKGDWHKTRFYPDKLAGYKMSPRRYVDIDTPEDYDWVQKIFSLIYNKQD